MKLIYETISPIQTCLKTLLVPFPLRIKVKSAEGRYERAFSSDGVPSSSGLSHIKGGCGRFISVSPLLPEAFSRVAREGSVDMKGVTAILQRAGYIKSTACLSAFLYIISICNQ